MNILWQRTMSSETLLFSPYHLHVDFPGQSAAMWEDERETSENVIQQKDRCSLLVGP